MDEPWAEHCTFGPEAWKAESRRMSVSLLRSGLADIPTPTQECRFPTRLVLRRRLVTMHIFRFDLTRLHRHTTGASPQVKLACKVPTPALCHECHDAASQHVPRLAGLCLCTWLCSLESGMPAMPMFPGMPPVPSMPECLGWHGYGGLFRHGHAQQHKA